MDGETPVGQVIQFQTTDDFSSVEFQFEVTAVSEVSEPTTAEAFHMVPNPVEDRATLHMTLSQPSEVTFQVLDAQGRLVERQDWGWMPAGVSAQSWSGPPRTRHVPRDMVGRRQHMDPTLGETMNMPMTPLKLWACAACVALMRRATWWTTPCWTSSNLVNRTTPPF